MFDYRELYKEEIKQATSIRNFNITIAALSNIAAYGFILDEPKPYKLVVLVPTVICTGINAYFIRKSNFELKHIKKVIRVIENEVYNDKELKKKKFKVIK